MLIILIVMALLAIIGGFLVLWKIPEAVEKKPNPAIGRTVSLIIPARDEAYSLPRLLASLKRQQLQPLEIIVVDDHSEDNTAQLAKEFGAHVIQPASNDVEAIGGKSAACWKGAQAAKGDWLVFLDADTQFENNDSFQRLLETFEAVGATGILSFQPYHQIEEAYENLSAVFNIILMAGMNVFTPLGAKLTEAGAFGPGMIVNKTEYFVTGGHHAVSRAVLDDLALGAIFRKHGFPVCCYSGRGMIKFRMYPEGMQQMLEGWTKGFGTAAQSTHPGVMLLISLWIAGAFVSSGTLVLSLFLGQSISILIAALLCFLYAIQFYWQARRVGNFSLLILWFYPFLFLFFVVVFLRSVYMTKVLKKVKWRGRDLEV